MDSYICSGAKGVWLSYGELAVYILDVYSQANCELFSDPNNDSPLNAQAAKLWKSEEGKHNYNKTVGPLLTDTAHISDHLVMFPASDTNTC